MNVWRKKINLDFGLIIVILLGLIFFGVYSYLAWQLPLDWSGDPKLILNSPDETANLFFSRHLALTGTMLVSDPANGIGGELIAPRSMRLINNQIVPAGFIGLPIIYGTLAKIFGLGAIPFFTPAFAIIGIIFFYLLVKKLFGQQAALWAAVFAYLLPAYWYYSVKGLMPNVAFASLFIIALYFFLAGLDKKTLTYYLLFGVFLGLGLMVRTSEAVWVGTLFFILTLINLKKVNWSYLFCSLVGAVLFFTPVLYFNKQIYNSPWSIGYALQPLLVGQNVLEQGLSLIKQILLPFGFNFKTALFNFYHYTFVLFPLWSVLTASGFFFSLIWLIIKKNRPLLAYSLLLAAVGFYLIIFYGSWQFSDNPDPGAVTIGTSYVRYWLLIYLFCLPYPAWLMVNLFKKFTLGLPTFGALLFTCFFLVSYQAVALAPGEGVYQVAKNIREYQQLAKAVFSKTEPNSVIVAGRLDKVFWPNRRVIFKLNNNADYARIKELLANNYPVYYFDFTLDKEDLTYINQQIYEPRGLQLSDGLLKFGKQNLYQIRVIK